MAWGPDAWQWSGFLHLGLILYVLPYPSTLALAVTLGVLPVVVSTRLAPSLTFVLVAVGAWFVTLVHPYTAAFAAAGLIALGLRPAARPFVVRGAIAWLAGSALAVTWPLFPFLGLVGSSGSYAAEQAPMYRDALHRIAPALLGLVAMVARTRRDGRDPLLPWFMILAALYTVGGVTGNYTLGRVLPQAVLALHLAIAIAITNGATMLRGRDRRLAIAYSAAMVVALAVPMYPEVHSQIRAGYGDARIRDLIVNVPQSEVVLAHPETSRLIPASGRRVVSWPGAVPFIADIDARRADVSTFFDPKTSHDERKRIAARWGRHGSSSTSIASLPLSMPRHSSGLAPSRRRIPQAGFSSSGCGPSSLPSWEPEQLALAVHED